MPISMNHSLDSKMCFPNLNITNSSSFLAPSNIFSSAIAPYLFNSEAAFSKITSFFKGTILDKCMATPDYLHRVFRSGFIISASATAGIIVKNGVPPYQEYKAALDKLNTYAKNNPDENAPYLAACRELKEKKDDNNLGITSYVKPLYLTRCVLKAYTSNHRAMINALRSLVADIGTMTIDEIIKKLHEAHRCLFEGVWVVEKDRYRSVNMIVFSIEAMDYSVDQKEQYLIQRGGTIKDRKIFNELFRKNGIFRAAKIIKLEERATLSKIAFVPYDHELVPAKMKEFLTQLQQSIKAVKQDDKVNLMALAAFIHHEITSIHPYANGNGRLARGLMNALLMQFGAMPIVFPDNDEYTTSVEKDGKNPGYLTTYFIKQAIPNMLVQMPNLLTWEKTSK